MNPADLNEALLFQRRQQEIQRDLQVREMLLLRGQMDRHQNIHQQHMFGLQQPFGNQQTLAGLQHEHQVIQDQLMRRRQLQQQIQNNRMAPLSSIAGSPIQRSINTEALITDSLTANASRRSTGNRKRSMSSNEDKMEQSSKRFREHSPSKQSDAMLLAEVSLQNMNYESDLKTKPRASRNLTHSPSEITFEAQALEGFQELLNARKEQEPVYDSSEMEEAEEEMLYTKGTIDALLEAGKAEQEVDDAATVMVTLNDIGELSDSDPEESGIGSGDDDGENTAVIDLPGFSRLPRLPTEPVLEETRGKASPGKRSPQMTSPQKSTDESKKDEKDAAVVSDDKETVSDSQNGSPEKMNGQVIDTNQSDVIQTETIQPVEYPYPVDTWWPSITTIRREGKTKNGEEIDQDSFVEEAGLFQYDSSFIGDTRKIRDRLANDVEPGVLEKIPHCKIHRLKTRAQKGANIPDHAFCWQVTETYCTEVMVCCSICSTWRHAGCGGHHKSIRESVESKEPFEAICDLCYEEQALVQQYPRGEARLERQRIEQLRRALSTSAVIRQAAFVKYGGTYKWPLGSVSSTHIGGHTRSVHSRHDKAEKTWSDMTSRLGRDNPRKEKAKTRTREFERLLVCLEDAGTFECSL